MTLRILYPSRLCYIRYKCSICKEIITRRQKCLEYEYDYDDGGYIESGWIHYHLSCLHKIGIGEEL